MDLVTWLGLRGARTAIERLYSHPPHQCFDMPAADLAPLQSQQAAQHTRTGEGIRQVQPVETLHDRQIGVRHRARQIVDAAAADLQSFRLSCDRQIVLTVDHRFALSNPALVSAPSKNHSPASTPRSWHAATSHRPQAWPRVPPPDPKTSEALPSSCDFQDVI